MIAISNKQRDAAVRLLDYMASRLTGTDGRTANARRMARLVAQRLRTKQPAKAGCEVMYFIGGLEG